MVFNQAIPTFFTHPFILELLQIATITLVIGFTSASSVIRPAFLPLVIAITAYSIPRCFDRTQNVIWNGPLAGDSTAYVLQYIEIALLGRYAMEAGGPTNPDRNLRFVKQGQDNSTRKPRATRDKGCATVWERIQFGFFALFSQRLVGTPFEVPGVPPFSSKVPSYIPERSAFLRRRALQVFINYLTLDLLGAVPPDPGSNATMFSPRLIPFFSRLGEVTAEQIIARVVSMAFTWVSIYCIIQVIQGLVAIVAVGCVITEVKTWRPVFGSLGDAYTVRRFWGLFWHQLNRQKLCAPASWVTYSFLKLRKGSISGRYIFCFLVFLISGVQHQVIDVAAGTPWSKGGAARFFVTQFFGVLLEDAVQEIWRRSGGKSGGKAVKTIGLLWVFLFHAWSLPAWIYPIMMVDLGKDKYRAVPFSVAKPLLGLLAQKPAAH